MEEQIMNRIQEISDEYAQLPELDKYDLTLEAGDKGEVKVTLKKDNIAFERTIGSKEALDFITDTFNYSDTYSPRSKDINLKGLKRAYFNEFGRLVVEKEDTTEVFKIQPHQKEKVIEILKEKMGKLFKG